MSKRCATPRVELKLYPAPVPRPAPGPLADGNAYLPTEAEIREACLAIQATWTADDFVERSGGVRFPHRYSLAA